MINEIKLYIVPTPIGNLDDITIRAIDTLKNSDLILSEDTRHAKKLLSHYKISTKVKSYHLNNEHKKVDEYVELLLTVLLLVIYHLMPEHQLQVVQEV